MQPNSARFSKMMVGAIQQITLALEIKKDNYVRVEVNYNVMELKTNNVVTHQEKVHVLHQEQLVSEVIMELFVYVEVQQFV